MCLRQGITSCSWVTKQMEGSYFVFLLKQWDMGETLFLSSCYNFINFAKTGHKEETLQRWDIR